MKHVLFSILLLYSFQSIGKGKKEMGEVSVIKKVDTVEQIALIRQVQKVVRDGVVGERAIKDDSCRSLVLVSEDEILEVLVNNKPLYILDHERTINFKRYTKSTCYKSIAGNIDQIECIARSLDAIENIDEDDKLVFYIKYRSDAILVCPNSTDTIN